MGTQQRKDGIWYISIDKLLLDQNNPRLAGEKSNDSQEDILRYIYDNEELDELASSLATHGFFPEEPIIAIPRDAANFELISDNNKNEFDYIVVEGNRRLSSVKLLRNSKLRKTVDVQDNFPQAGKEIMDNLKQLPVILYKDRKSVAAYIGVRHIAGNRKWDAFAKAKYIHDKVEDIMSDEKLDARQAIDKVKRTMADRKGMIIQNYVYYKVFDIINNDILDGDSRHVKGRFSLIEVALSKGRNSIAEYLGIKPFNDIDLNSAIIKNDKMDNLKDVVGWIFGLKSEPDKLITDSRLIGSRLQPILANREATDYLRKFRDLENAYELSGGERELVKRNVIKSYKLLSNIVSLVHKIEDTDELKNDLDDIISLVNTIKQLIK